MQLTTLASSGFLPLSHLLLCHSSSSSSRFCLHVCQSETTQQTSAIPASYRSRCKLHEGDKERDTHCMSVHARTHVYMCIHPAFASAHTQLMPTPALLISLTAKASTPSADWLDAASNTVLNFPGNQLPTQTLHAPDRHAAHAQLPAVLVHQHTPRAAVSSPHAQFHPSLSCNPDLHILTKKDTFTSTIKTPGSSQACVLTQDLQQS